MQPVLGGCRQLGCGDAVAAVQVDHRPGNGGVGADHLGDLGGIDLGIEIAVEHDFPQLGHQSGVVVGGEERRVDTEHLGDPQQHRDGERTDVVLDLAKLRAELKTVLADYKVPKQIEFRTDLPKTNVGKILRRELRDEKKAAA